MNWVFATKSNCLMPISLQRDGVNLGFFKLRLFDIQNSLGCKDARIRKSDFLGKDSISSFSRRKGTTNSDFLIPLSLQPNVIELRHFKIN